jgi:hypothetical protein
MARTTERRRRVRLAREPPWVSVRVFEAGERKEERR